MSTLAEVDVLFRGRTRGFNKALRKSEKRVRRFSRIAKRSIKVVTAAFAAAGAAGTKFAADFEESTTRLETLVGLSADQVSKMREEILQLAPAVGKSPERLSEALFAITSAGLRGEEAMELLRQSAKASVVGLGNVREIGRTATAALNAFGDAGLTAKEAIDQMVVTVRKGNLRAEDLAVGLSKVFGIASQVGVSFEEVNAFVATFTRLGAKARVAARSLRQVLGNVIKPSKQSRKAFQKAGTSIEEFREEIQEKGLTQALIDLIQAQEGNLDAIGQLIPDIRALAGVLSTAGSQADTFAEIFRSLQDATGATNKAFEKANRTLSQLTRRVLRSAQVGLIRIAREFFPELKTFARFLRKQMPKAFAAFIRGMRSLAQAAIVTGAKFASSPIGKLMGLEAGPRAETFARIEELREKHRSLLEELTDPGRDIPIGGGQPLGRPRSEVVAHIRAVQERLTELRQQAFDIPFLNRLDKLADRLESGIAGGASNAADALEDMNTEIKSANTLIREMLQDFEGLSGLGGDGAPSLARLPSLQGRIQARRRMVGAFQRLEEIAGGPITIQRIADATSDLTSEGEQQIPIWQGLTSAISQLSRVADDALSKILSFAAGLASAIGSILQASGAGGIIAGAGTALGAFAGLFQHGGRIPSGQFGIVGEDGPELVSGPAEVTPMRGGVGVLNAEALRPVTRATMAQDPEVQRWLGDLNDAGRLMGRG